MWPLFCQGVLAPIWHLTGPSCLLNLPSSLRTFPTKYVSCQQQQELKYAWAVPSLGVKLDETSNLLKCWSNLVTLPKLNRCQCYISCQYDFLQVQVDLDFSDRGRWQKPISLTTSLVDFIQNVNLLKCAWGNEPIHGSKKIKNKNWPINNSHIFSWILMWRY